MSFQESSLPKDLSAMAQLCSNALSNPNTRPVIVIVDAINQVCTQWPPCVLIDN